MYWLVIHYAREIYWTLKLPSSLNLKTFLWFLWHKKFEYFHVGICKFSAYMVLKWDKTLWKVHLWEHYLVLLYAFGGNILFERLTLQVVKQFKSHYKGPFWMHLMFLIVNEAQCFKSFKRDFFFCTWFWLFCQIVICKHQFWHHGLKFMFFLASFFWPKILKNFWLLDSLSKVIYFFFSKKQTIL